MTDAASTPKIKQLSEAGLAGFKQFFGASTSWPMLLASDLQSFLFGNLPGVLGYASRSITQPYLLKSCGRRPAIGRQVQIRNPNAVIFGNKILIDDYAVLDPQGEGAMLELADAVSIGKFSLLVAKRGVIKLASAVNIASPNPLSNEAFMGLLRKAWGQKIALPTYRWMLELGAFFLRTESELVLKSRRVVPLILLDTGFKFEFSNWEQASVDLCKRWKNGG